MSDETKPGDDAELEAIYRRMGVTPEDRSVSGLLVRAAGWRMRTETAEVELARLTTLRPLDDYHEDDGAVLWWRVPIVEPPHVGWGPGLDEDFPEGLTYWSPVPPVKEPGQ